VFRETNNKCYFSTSFVYKTDPLIYKKLTNILLNEKNLFKELKRITTPGNLNTYNSFENEFDSLSSLKKDYLKEKFKFSASFEVIHNNLSDLLNYEQFFRELGAGLKFNPLSKKESSGQFLKKTYELLDKFENFIQPKIIFKKIKVVVKKSNIELCSYKKSFNSKKIASFFSGFEKNEIILYVVTIGSKIDNQIKVLSKNHEIFDAYTLNAVGGAAVEMAANDFNLYVNQNFLKDNNLKYKRFSPGYGDWDLEEQQIIFNILKPQKLIGVKLNDGNIMDPEKSTSGMMSIVRTK
jgi:5-methyltetrahydrofolate--homocysteine methyltransferase